MKRYPVPSGVARVTTRASNSRFITTLGPAPTIPAARGFLRDIRAEMPDATHHVYAYRVGYGASIAEGMSDDGEPSGTSGPPVLAVLRGTDVGDVACVVTRYFGGTKLGTGGLVAAYGDAVKAAVAAMVTEEKIIRCPGQVTLPYALLDAVRKALHTHECLVDDEVYGELITLQIRLPVDHTAALAQRLADLSAGRIGFSYRD